VRLADDLERLVLESDLDSLAAQIQPLVRAAFVKIWGRDPNMSRIGVVFGQQDKAKDLAKYEPMKDGRSAEIVIDPVAWKKTELQQWIITHEMIHHALEDENTLSHGPEFHQMAQELGVPPKYRD
jgi:hypothetical protein